MHPWGWGKAYDEREDEQGENSQSEAKLSN
jgi:hypothetical protein